VNAEESSVWEGRFDQPARGRLKLALQQVEGPEAAADPVWHVRTRWEVQTAPAARSFVAEMEGMVDWKADTAHLSGVITSVSLPKSPSALTSDPAMMRRCAPSAPCSSCCELYSSLRDPGFEPAGS
jgi:hypothetical protein